MRDLGLDMDSLLVCLRILVCSQLPSIARIKSDTVLTCLSQYLILYDLLSCYLFHLYNFEFRYKEDKNVSKKEQDAFIKQKQLLLSYCASQWRIFYFYSFMFLQRLSLKWLSLDWSRNLRIRVYFHFWSDFICRKI